MLKSFVSKLSGSNNDNINVSFSSPVFIIFNEYVPFTSESNVNDDESAVIFNSLKETLYIGR